MGTQSFQQVIDPIGVADAISSGVAILAPGGDVPFNGVLDVNVNKNGYLELTTASIITFASTAGTGNLTIIGEDIRGKVITEVLDNTQATYETVNYFQVIHRMFLDGPGSTTLLDVGMDGRCSSRFFHMNPNVIGGAYDPGIFIQDLTGTSDFIFSVAATPDNVSDVNVDLATIGEFPHPNLSLVNINLGPAAMVQSYDNKALFTRLVVVSFVQGQGKFSYVF